MKFSLSDNVLYEILECSDDLIGIIDEKNIYQFVNKSLAISSGYFHPSEMVGHRVKDILSPEVYKQVKEANQEALKGKKVKMTTKQISSDGQFIWYEVVLSPITDPTSGKYNVLFIARDITERVLAERKMEALNQELERLSIIDYLTNIPNRRYFGEKLESLWKLHVRIQQPLTIMLCDIDKFKAYNDNYGHLAGDDTLVKVANALKNVIRRSSDFVARYGGEEFVFVLSDTNKEGAQIFARHIHQAIADLAIEHAYSSVFDQLTLSIGFFSYIPKQSNLPEMSIALADKALYQVKRSGRNHTLYETHDDL
jgi:diguanylate cyclase (GGDEF)-like protein/PAS domain S-box-containing protein